jgi:hypothetical protein
MRFNKKLNTIAINIILTLSLIFHIQAIILKLICNKKLNIKNNIEYFNIDQD